MAPIALFNQKNTAFRSMTISLLMHAIFFKVFIFTLSTQPIAPRPLLVFLGPILKDESLGLKVYDPFQKRGDTLRDVPLNLNATGSLSQYPDPIPKSKPTVSFSVPAPKKRYMKSTFQHGETPAPSEQKKEKKILGIDLNLEPRTPLRLNR